MTTLHLLVNLQGFLEERLVHGPVIGPLHLASYLPVPYQNPSSVNGRYQVLSMAIDLYIMTYLDLDQNKDQK